MTQFSLNPGQTALVLIDLQQGIVRLPVAPNTAESVLDASARLLAASRAAGILPIWVRVGGAVDQSDRLFPPADQPAARAPMPADYMTFAPQIAPANADDVVVLKRQWGGFYGTDLELQLRRRGIDTLILAGIATEIGVESTARDAYERGFSQYFVRDAMSGLSAEGHAHSIERIFPRMGRVRTTDQLCALLAGA